MRFIHEYKDHPKICGFIEMDIDIKVGYEKTLEWRRKLETVSDKIIPVWHKNRGIEEYTKMCQEYAGKIVAVAGSRNNDIREDQYMLFLKEAWKYGCKLHGLGITRKAVIDKVPFDMCDSSTWVKSGVYGLVGTDRVGKHVPSETVKYYGYLHWVKRQEYYEKKWKRVIANKHKFFK